jgi:hypothetical protein
MSQDFTVKPTQQMKDAIGNATSSQELRELMDDLVLRQRRDPNAPAPEPVLSADLQPSSGTSHSRIIYIINDRYEIFSGSSEGLDAKEAALRQIFGK